MSSSTSISKRWALGFLTSFAIAMGTLAAFNYAVDSDGRARRNDDFEHTVAARMNEGLAVVGTQNLRTVALQRALILSRQATPDVAVLGSSRVLMVSQAETGQARVLNHGVFSARLAQQYGIVGTYLAKGALPKTIILGTDPWLFKKENVNAWPMAAEAEALGKRLGIDPRDLGADDSTPWRSLFSLEAAKANKAMLMRNWPDQPCDGVTFSQSEETPCALRRPDGSLRYPLEMRNRSPAEVDAEIAQEVSRRGRMHSHQGFDQLDPRRVEAYAKLLKFLKDSGSHVIVLLSPYHPLVERAYQGRLDWNLVLESNQTVRRIAGELGIEVVGDFSASAAGCAAKDFYDAIHPKEACIRRILGRE